MVLRWLDAALADLRLTLPKKIPMLRGVLLQAYAVKPAFL